MIERTDHLSQDVLAILITPAPAPLPVLPWALSTHLLHQGHRYFSQLEYYPNYLRSVWEKAKQSAGYACEPDRLAHLLFLSVVFQDLTWPAYLREVLQLCAEALARGAIEWELFLCVCLARAMQLGEDAFLEENSLWSYEDAQFVRAYRVHPDMLYTLV